MNATAKSCLFFLTFLAAIVGLFLLASPAQAVEGTCSWHGGVSCSAGADWDGSAICKDGWRDSSEAYTDQVACKNYRHSCTSAERESIERKYDIDGQWAVINQRTETMMAAISDSVKTVQLSAEIQALQGKLKLSMAQADQECYALGDAAYYKSQANLYSQLQTSQAQTRTCTTGYTLYAGQCHTPSEICALGIGSGAYSPDGVNCACKSGYKYDSSIKNCVASPQSFQPQPTQIQSVPQKQPVFTDGYTGLTSDERCVMLGLGEFFNATTQNCDTCPAGTERVAGSNNCQKPVAVERKIAAVVKEKPYVQSISSIEPPKQVKEATTSAATSSATVTLLSDTPAKKPSTFWQRLASPFKSFWDRIFR